MRYVEGKHVPKDAVRGAARLTRACELDAKHCYSYGVALEQGVGMKKDLAKARSVYERACNANDADACNNLGFLFDHGHGGPQSDERAKELFKRACDGGNELGCKNLGKMK